MNYIKIYFALPDELSKERDELADYIRSLNDFYHDRDIFFEVNFSENPFDSFDDFPSASDSDNEENQIDAIRESNYFYLIFGCHDDEGIREKFDVALAEFEKNGAPKIYTYFKKLPEGVETEQGIKNFIDRLDQAIGHYYSQFVHIDSVKLNILLELTNTSKNGDKLEFEDGHATINGTKVLPLENIPIYQCNESLQRLKAEKARLEQEFAGAAVNYAQNPNDQEAFNKMMDLSGERNRVTDKIHEIEKGMLGLCNTISEMRHSDRKLTWREVEAGKRLDMGDYDGALMILKDDQREKELAQAEAIANEGIERIRGYIAENRMIISTLKTKGVSVDTLDELYSRYEKNTELAKEYHIELKCVYDYMSFLRIQKEFSKAIELGEWLLPFYQRDDERLDILNLLGMIYHDIHNFQEAKGFYEQALDVARRLAQKNQKAYESCVATICNNLAILQTDLCQYEESEELYLDALEIWKRLAQVNPEVYENDVANTYGNLANLLSRIHWYKQSEKLYCEALKIHRRLAQKNPEAYENDVAMVCNNLAGLLSRLHRYEESKKLYYEALTICRRQAKTNPEAYGGVVADICNNLAVLLNDLDQCDMSEQLYREALTIRRRQAQRNPEAYEKTAADTCNNFGTLLQKLHRYEESEALYREALEIYRRLAEKNPDIYKSDVARTCYNLAYLMCYVQRFDEAEMLYREALKIYRICAQNNPEAYESDMAHVCLGLANILNCQCRYLTSKNLYFEALNIFWRLDQEYPGVYKIEIASIYYNLSMLMMDLQDYEMSEKLCCASLRLYKSLTESNPKMCETMCGKCEKMLHKLHELQH